MTEPTEQPSPNTSPKPAKPLPEPKGYWQRATRFAHDMVKYYRENRSELSQYIMEVTPFLERTGDREREIRITKDDAVGAAAFADQIWRLTFPDCCVVTGERADGPWIDREVTLPNVAWPALGTAAGFFGGLLLSLIFKFWFFWPIFLWFGMALGFAKRQTRVVQLHYRKSSQGAESEDANYPLVWLLPNGLLVRLGSNSAKKAFVKHRVDMQESDRHSAVSIAPRRAAETLKLDADDASGEPSPPPSSAGRQDLPPIRLDDE